MSPFSVLLGMCAAALASTAPGTAQQLTRAGSFDLPCSADNTFPLFSPEGEREWIKGWDPQPVFPDTIVFARDTVFREGQGDQQAVWTIVDADRQTYRAEYVRVAGASHAAHIVVKIEPLGTEHSNVIVSYTVTAFGADAATVLESFSESAYAARMRNWQRQINELLERRRSR